MSMKPKDAPDHHDAELVIKLYELRREGLMREARNAINGDLWPTKAEELLAFTKSDHPQNAAWRQVTTYWEMVYGMVVHGVLHGDFMLESSGEGMFLFARVKPFLADLRAAGSPRAFHNTEWVANHSPFAKEVYARYEKGVQARLAARAKR